MGKCGGGETGKQYQARTLREVRKKGTGEEENRGSKEGSKEVELGREETEKQESMEAEKQGNKYQVRKQGC